MATHRPGTIVVLDDGALGRLRFPPPDSEAVIAVHGAALRAPDNRLTLAVCLDEAETPVWVGALDEGMVLGGLGKTASPRPAVAGCLLAGDRYWDVVWPGELLHAGGYGTIYRGDRPWVVLGTLPSGALLASPLNDARGNPKWYAPRIEAADLEGVTAKAGQLELAHLWSLPEHLPAVGAVGEAARAELGDRVRTYYG
jgi:hypothetical protein